MWKRWSWLRRDCHNLTALCTFMTRAVETLVLVTKGLSRCCLDSHDFPSFRGNAGPGYEGIVTVCSCARSSLSERWKRWSWLRRDCHISAFKLSIWNSWWKRWSWLRRDCHFSIHNEPCAFMAWKRWSWLRRDCHEGSKK